MAVIVDPVALGGYLQRTVSGRTAAVVNEVVSGWLAAATGSVPTPPLAPDLWAWALELAGIAYVQMIPADAAPAPPNVDPARLGVILRAVGAKYGSTGGPLFSFPEWDWSWSATPAMDPRLI